MTALNADIGPKTWAQELPIEQRRPYAGVVAAGKRCYYTSICMQVDGKAMPVVSGAAMKLLCKSFTGGDANSTLYISARNTNVRVALTSSNAESLAISYGATVDVTITYNNGTSTPNSLAALIRAHAEADRLLRAGVSGTGAGTALVAVLIANGAVPHIDMLGVPSEPLDATGNADLPIRNAVAFDCGVYAANPDAAGVPAEGSWATVLDDYTYSSAADPLALRVPIRYTNDPRGYVYGDLREAR